MSLLLSNCVFFGSHSRSSRFSHASASLEVGVQRAASAIAPASASFEETKGRIAKLFHKNEVSVSTYDTAWVAMVPSPTSSEEPCFPASLNWLLENQCLDGSWALPHHHPMLKKDVLSSTLACILALQKWGVGEDQINKGLHFIELNFASATDDKCQITPMGFDIVFPAMLDRARAASLNLCLEPTVLNDLMNKRDLELKRCYQSNSTEREVYWAYIAEGMGKLQKWESVMKYQRKNGSLFNCPSTTAAAFTVLGNSDCLNYLHLALNKFGGAVPAVYPLDIYSQLCIVDNLEMLGISRHFLTEIQSVLDETYRCWVQGDEEIVMDASTCALAFRTLRKNGYNVSSDPITKILQDESFGGNMRDMNTTLELYRASELILHPDERDLEKHNLRLKNILEHKLSGGGFIQSRELGRNIDAEVRQALEYPFYATIDRMAKRRNIEQYHFDNTRVLKTSYCSPNFGNEDFLRLSVEDFNRCQVMHQEELRELERWEKENRLDELKFARSKAAYCSFSASATFFSPELSEARMSYAKNAVLTIVVDDFFDVAGSAEELNNLIELFELWDVDVSTDCISPSVQIIFSALKHTICEIGDTAFKIQGRSITDHIISIWLDVLHSMMKENEWSREKTVPTIDEYIRHAYVSFALGPMILPSLYLVGPKISEEMVNHADYHNLFKSMSTCGRLLNDIRTCERELKAGKLNALALYMMKNGGEMSREAAVLEVKSWIDRETRQLLRSVLEEKNVVPKACKELFWHMSTVVHLFYIKDDGFTSQDLLSVVNQIIYQPLVLE